MRAEALNRYVSAFEVYTGTKEDSVERGLGADVVKSLTEDLHNTTSTLWTTALLQHLAPLITTSL